MALKYLSLADLRERYACSKMWVYRRIASGNFPRPQHLGGSRASRWRLDDVEAWETNPDNHPDPVVAVAERAHAGAAL
jgi:predicted DNA-binding transcriptional regulator AlpA